MTHRPFAPLKNLFVNERGDLENIHQSKSPLAKKIKKQRQQAARERRVWREARNGNLTAVMTLIKEHGLTPEIVELRGQALAAAVINQQEEA